MAYFNISKSEGKVTIHKNGSNCKNKQSSANSLQIDIDKTMKQNIVNHIGSNRDWQIVLCSKCF